MKKTLELLRADSNFMLLIMMIFVIAPFYYYQNIGGVALNLPANINIWLAVTVFIFLTIIRLLHIKLIRLPPHFLLLSSFALLATISGFVTGVQQPIDWLFRLLFIWGGIAFLIALFQYPNFKKHMDIILLLVVISGLIHAFIASTQILQPEEMSLFIRKTPLGNWPTGLFLQVNVQASYQATTILLCFYLATRVISQNKYILFIQILAVLLGSFIIASSGSRVGFLGVVIGSILFFIFRYHYIKKCYKKIALLLTIFLLGFGIVWSGIAGNTSGPLTLMEKATSEREYSSGERVVIYSVAVDLIKQKPLFGHGLGSFPSKWQHQKAEYFEAHPDIIFNSNYVTHPHNELLFWQVEGGLIATFGILITSFTFLYLVWKTRQLFVLALLFPIALHTLVELPFYLSVSHWFVFLVLIGLGVLDDGSVKRINLSFTSYMETTLKLTNYLVLFIALVFIFHTMYANRVLYKFQELDGIDPTAAIINPYFSGMAREMAMQKTYYYSMKAQSETGLHSYLNWAESAINERPIEPTFMYMISSYQTLDMRAKACEIAEQARRIYPNNHQFKEYVFSCG